MKFFKIEFIWTGKEGRRFVLSLWITTSLRELLLRQRSIRIQRLSWDMSAFLTIPSWRQVCPFPVLRIGFTWIAILLLEWTYLPITAIIVAIMIFLLWNVYVFLLICLISLVVSHCRLVLLLHRHLLLFLVYFVVLLCQINRIVFYLKFWRAILILIRVYIISILLISDFFAVLCFFYFVLFCHSINY